MSLTFALLGNPNSGKTTLFNQLTGSNHQVGNWPGVTVERKSGKLRNVDDTSKHHFFKNKKEAFNKDVNIIDLPGAYSLIPYSPEESITRDFILGNNADVIINIVDATALERSLYMTTQLIELKKPIIVALNMMDALEMSGKKINVKLLESQLGVKIVPISANSGKGIRELVHESMHICANKTIGENKLFYNKDIESAIEFVTKNSKIKLSRYEALLLLESNESNMAGLNEYIKTFSEKYPDLQTKVANNRYKFIGNIIKNCVLIKGSDRQRAISDKIDDIVCNRFMAIPFFLFIMFGIFELTFHEKLGGALVTYMENLVAYASTWAQTMLEIAGASPWAISLVVDGILAGVGSVISFLPQIVLLFFFLSMLEDSGYMARAAFIMDRLFQKLGLSGRCFLPMLMGFGCSVPAIMATRTIENEKDRRLTIILTPFMSCGAKMPVYAVIVGAFFPKNTGLVIFSLYLVGVLVAILSGMFLSKSVFSGKTPPFVMELPLYRFPTFKGTILSLRDKSWDFVRRAGTVILASSIIIWLLQNFSFTFQMVGENVENSMLSQIGSVIAVIFKPLGFGGWQESVAIITGIIAKEAIVSTLGIVYKVGASGDIGSVLVGNMTHLAAYSMLIFILLYMPCLAAFAATKKEMNSWKWSFFAVLYQTGVAWVLAFLVFNIGKLFL